MKTKADIFEEFEQYTIIKLGLQSLKRTCPGLWPGFAILQLLFLQTVAVVLLSKNTIVINKH